MASEETIRRALELPLPEGPRLAAKAYDELFSGATDEKLRSLARDPNPSVALQARWQLRTTDHALPSDITHPDHIPGFLEGDFGLRVPVSWAVDFAFAWYQGSAEAGQLAAFYHRVGFAGIGEKAKYTFEEKDIWLHTIDLQPDLHRTSYGGACIKAR